MQFKYLPSLTERQSPIPTELSNVCLGLLSHWNTMRKKTTRKQKLIKKCLCFNTVQIKQLLISLKLWLLCNTHTHNVVNLFFFQTIFHTGKHQQTSREIMFTSHHQWWKTNSGSGFWDSQSLDLKRYQNAHL